MFMPIVYACCVWNCLWYFIAHLSLLFSYNLLTSSLASSFLCDLMYTVMYTDIQFWSVGGGEEEKEKRWREHIGIWDDFPFSLHIPSSTFSPCMSSFLLSVSLSLILILILCHPSPSLSTCQRSRERGEKNRGCDGKRWRGARWLVAEKEWREGSEVEGDWQNVKKEVFSEERD